MAGFGEEIRRERESRGVSLEMLAAETRVNVRHLAALEANQFTALPGGVFRRGIVRAYLAALGLTEADWLPRFEREAGTENPGQEAWAEFAENVKRNRPSPEGSQGLRWLGVLLLLLLVLLAAYGTWRLVLGGSFAR